MYQWIVYVHVLAGFAFFLAHGASATIAFRLRYETNLDRIKALLDLSPFTLSMFGISLLVQLIAGIVAGFMQDWWRQGWIWGSIGLFIVLVFGMYRYAQAHYHPLRQALGLPYMAGNRQMPAQSPRSNDEVYSIIAQTNPNWLTAFGFGIPAIILFLMMFKPF